MSIKQKLFCFKLLCLLLCLNTASVEARTFTTNISSESNRALTLEKEQSVFHKNILQPQVVQFVAIQKHTVKPINLGCSILFSGEKMQFSLQKTGQTNTILQDANRCESVSRFLFPYHFFW
jgi:hypothetical protein